MLDLRRVGDALGDPRVEYAYATSSEERQKELWELVKKHNADGIRRWAKDNALPLLSVKELRLIAHRKGINPNGLDKGQLLAYLEAHERKMNARTAGLDAGSSDPSQSEDEAC
jgi:hypothetical protein